MTSAFFALLVIAAYALGTFPTALLVARSAGHDPTAEGSGNPGASNVYRVAGASAGVLVFVGDFAKGVVAAGAGLAIDGRPLGMACGVAAVIGHIFPVTRRLRGGRGVATAAGMATVLYPLPSAALAVLWFASVRLTRKASLGSLSVAVAMPIVVALIGRPVWEVATVAGLAVLVLARHASNVRRLFRGEEAPLRSGQLRLKEGRAR